MNTLPRFAQPETWHVARIKPNPRNARIHPPEQIELLRRSLREYGWTIPVLVDEDGLLLAGHGRLEAARLEGHTEVPVVVARGWTAEQKRAYALFDNQITSGARWNEGLVLEELGQLQGLGIDFGLTGFNLHDFEAGTLFGETPPPKKFLAEPDDAPTPPDKPVSRAGDLWRLGKHRALCGDACAAEAVTRLLDGAKPHLMVTDPPYGVNYDPAWRNRVHRKDGSLVGGLAVGIVHNDHQDDWREAWALFAGQVAYVWHGSLHTAVVAASLQASGFELRSNLIWAKQQFAIGRGDYHWQHEPCQPAGTLVSKVLKEGRWREHSTIEDVPIECLQPGDRVVSFGNAKIYRRGRSITRIGSRQYGGNMHTVAVGAKSTRATAEHQFTVRFDPDAADKYVVYLMRRGQRWRVGISALFNSRGFGLAVRLSQERGDDAWIVSAHDELLSARVAEQVVSCVYGVPTTHWETENKPAVGEGVRTPEHIEQIYRQIGTDRLAAGVHRLFADRGLSLAHPLISAEEVGRFSRSQARIVRACNLVPGIMQLPVPTTGEDFDWLPISEATFAPFVGEVYSMDVDQDQHYVADGIVTHNCWYVVRKGKAGRWTGDRKQTTVWNIDKPHRSELGHSTQKPVECMRRPILNNSNVGDAVYDPFLGSGTTIIAAEMEKRACYGLEIDPAYCDVIVKRWAAFTGQKPVLDSDATGKRIDRTFDEIAEERRAEEAA